MSFQLNLPPSVITKIGQDAEPQDGEPEGEPQESGKKREDWKKLKELEEARKAGTAPAMQDEEGRDINPHIPQYIMQAPWYFGATQPTLNHQRQQEDKIRNFSEGWYKKGVKDSSVATKFRKGACENCGAITHKKKDCLERPRKIGARFTGQDFAPDEHVQENFEFDYDGKRDRWNGYDTADHKRIVEEFQKIDEAKRLLKAERLEDAVQKGELAPEEAQKAVEEEGEEEDKYADDVDMPGQKFETKQRITVRNLRIREDTAKYLYNLNVDSAYYDPKTRSMRDNPFKTTGKQPKDLPYAGDNFTRWSGEAMEMAKQQLFAWEAYEKGSEVNLQADPTKLDMLTREYEKKKGDYKKSTKESILEKYGGQEHLEQAPKQMLLGQSEDYVEYSRQGTVLKGLEKQKVKSRYVEDVYTNNHTSVWGSFWKDGQWGYKCCHSFIRESYCTGTAGKEAEQMSIVTTTPDVKKGPMPSPEKTPLTSPLKAIMPAGRDDEDDAEATEEKVELTEREKRKLKKKEKKKRKKQKEKERKRKKKKNKKKHSSSSSDSDSSDFESEDEATKREKRILEAIRKEEARLAEVDTMMAVDERKRKYNVTYELKGPTEEEIEAYQRKRKRDDDPMAQFI